MAGELSLQAVVEAAQERVATIAGIRSTPDFAPESLAALPAAVAFPGKGRYVTGAFGIAESYHTLVIQVHFAGAYSARTLALVVPLVESVPAALTADPFLAGTCEAFSGISYEIGPMSYGGAPTFGIQFTIENVKLFPDGKH
jgi:hypothetical protein